MYDHWTTEELLAAVRAIPWLPLCLECRNPGAGTVVLLSLQDDTPIEFRPVCERHGEEQHNGEYLVYIPGRNLQTAGDWQAYQEQERP